MKGTITCCACGNIFSKDVPCCCDHATYDDGSHEYGFCRYCCGCPGAMKWRGKRNARRRYGVMVAIRAILFAYDDGALPDEAAMVALDVVQATYSGHTMILPHSGFQTEPNVECSMDEWWMEVVLPAVFQYGYPTDPWLDSGNRLDNGKS